ncbi:phosphatidylinositol 5-phosphate 4-kinase type-2 gamma-like isoform X3 [Thalassophryne amazonica]|uniref:phosphatidylinositol 5-phosphate 4-kinase type-2 gamma-like isoform X3 n=1 Tax=Thalassophryne amazonica TaxID=390379 RepID=UPI001470A11B|nr:phosphatidylinositol 5-phosphate 4-kinase type-2 gamma-like isoform X3 [Thalassophryne amazonica]
MTSKPAPRSKLPTTSSTKRIFQHSLNSKSTARRCSETSESALELRTKTTSPPVKNEERQTAGLLLTTFDRSLVVKEISSEEVEEIHSILSEYHQHIATCHGSTLLPQFLAMYRVTVESEDTHLLVMRNVFSHRLHIHTKYVLKVKDLPTYKDNDFKNSMQKVYVSDAEKKKFMDKLIRDTEFLVRMRIMDYSLLLGIHDVERAEKEEEEEMESSCEEDENSLALNPGSLSPEGIAGYINSFKPMGPGEFDPYVDVYAIQSTVGAPQREVYFMGLTDVLMHYDTKKKAAHAAKPVKHGAGVEISTTHPEQYTKRFRDFIPKIFA